MEKVKNVLSNIAYILGYSLGYVAIISCIILMIFGTVAFVNQLLNL